MAAKSKRCLLLVFRHTYAYFTLTVLYNLRLNKRQQHGENKYGGHNLSRCLSHSQLCRYTLAP